LDSHKLKFSPFSPFLRGELFINLCALRVICGELVTILCDLCELCGENYPAKYCKAALSRLSTSSGASRGIICSAVWASTRL